MQDLDTLRRTVATAESADAGYYVVERIDFTPEGVPVVEAFPVHGSALARFPQLAGEEITETAALRLIAEGGLHCPTFKVKLETALNSTACCMTWRIPRDLETSATPGQDHTGSQPFRQLRFHSSPPRRAFRIGTGDVTR